MILFHILYCFLHPASGAPPRGAIPGSRRWRRAAFYMTPLGFLGDATYVVQID